MRTMALALLMAPLACAAPAKLLVLQDRYPRAYFFRAAEGMASNARIPYGDWDATFARLMGIEGKCLDEEVPSRSKRNIAAFTRFKQRHPDQLVLLHYNGNARDPRDGTEEYFAGHWVYAPGVPILTDVPAQEGETVIRVPDTAPFHTNMGRYRRHNIDIGLCMIGPNGKLNWHESEQVQLIAVDAVAKTIRVRRGCYGTEPRAFPANQACAAAHVTEGPWGGRSNLLWFYNFSTRCPRDKQGRNCVDVYVDEFAKLFLPGGKLEAFDGVEFDVLFFKRFRGMGKYGPDCDADGKPDSGIYDGVNTYGIGVIDFLARLRAKVGDDVLLLADGHGPTHCRGHNILNGIESEGWPALNDWEMRDWSGGLNRHAFWNANGREPVFHYINHKYITAGDGPGKTKHPKVPWSTHRLVMAAAHFTGAAICYSWPPPRERDERFGIWDELRMGSEGRIAWLGRPLGPAVRLATRQPSLARLGRGAIEGEHIEIKPEGSEIRIVSTDPASRRIRFRVRGVPCRGPDLFVQLALRGAAMADYPAQVARLAWVGIASDLLVTPDPPATGMCVRGKEETPIDPGCGARVRFFARRTIGHETHAAYFVHPPWRGVRGYTFWERDVEAPPNGELRFYLGMGELSPERSDGVWFRVYAAAIGADGEPGPRKLLFEHVQKAHEWTHHTAPLGEHAGRQVRLRFVSDCGPGNNSTTDHSNWGDVRVVPHDHPDTFTTPVRFMTWCNDKPFTSGFYFNDVRTKEVDLAFDVEGAEPIWLSDLTIHARPDAIYREFAHGVVLANPSPREYEFGLALLLPGQRFRRLKGSPRQDRSANSGLPVGDTVTLGPRDALFLVRER